MDDLGAVLIRIFSCPLPTVVAVNGSAIAGGCLLACAFDTRLLAEDARIGVTELKVGVAFPVMTVELLKHVCGPWAEQVMLNAALLGADEAVASGLVHQVVPRPELDAAAITAAEHLGSLDARAYALAKESSSPVRSVSHGGPRRPCPQRARVGPLERRPDQDQPQDAVGPAALRRHQG